MSTLPQDLVEEILSRVPLTSLRAMRSTCRKWYTLYKDENFTKKYIAQAKAAAKREREFVAIMLLESRVYLMSVNLYGIHNNSDPLLKPIGKLISLDGLDQVKISNICHCEGLLLCTTEDDTRLVVWNLYSGKTRSICVEPHHHMEFWHENALGYDKSKSCRAFKILRSASGQGKFEYEIYGLNSNSWRVLDVTTDWNILYDQHSVSLKGNAYRLAFDKKQTEDFSIFLLCFDFTTEKFGPLLPLPFDYYHSGTVALSAFREEQLAVLNQTWPHHNLEMEIWVTTIIEPNAMSWNKFLAVTMGPLTGFLFDLGVRFLINEENKAVVVFDIDKHRSNTPTRHMSNYIIGDNGYFRKVDLGEMRPKGSYLRAFML